MLDEELSRDFYYDWKRSGLDPNVTPDGGTWRDQDVMFRHDVFMWMSIDEWAEDQVKHPRPKARGQAPKMMDIRDL